MSNKEKLDAIVESAKQVKEKLDVIVEAAKRVLESIKAEEPVETQERIIKEALFKVYDNED